MTGNTHVGACTSLCQTRGGEGCLAPTLSPPNAGRAPPGVGGAGPAGCQRRLGSLWGRVAEVPAGVPQFLQNQLPLGNPGPLVEAACVRGPGKTHRKGAKTGSPPACSPEESLLACVARRRASSEIWFPADDVTTPALREGAR